MNNVNQDGKRETGRSAAQAQPASLASQRQAGALPALTFHPMDEASARTVLGWRYPPPYEVYNCDPRRDEEVQALLNPEFHYQRIAAGDDPLVGYCCFGLDARVAGGDYSAAALDIGLMVRPDLNGRGLGAAFVQATLGFAAQQFPSAAWRVTIAGFNRRAQRVWEKAGFRSVQEFGRRGDGMPFRVFTREAPRT